MRRLLISATGLIAAAGAALAADLPLREPAPPPAYTPPLFTWSGLYLGGQIGYAWGTDSFWGAGPGYVFTGQSYTPSGVVGGAHVGYNYQFNQFVAGLEGDVEGLSYSKNYLFGNVTYDTNIPVQGSVRGRFGFALDRALFYATGGAAFAGVTTAYQTPFGYNNFNRSLAGWTVGGGLEYAVTNNWTVRAEYRYSDFGRFTDYPGSLPWSFVSHHETENAARVGFSYKFDSFAPLSVGGRF